MDKLENKPKNVKEIPLYIPIYYWDGPVDGLWLRSDARVCIPTAVLPLGEVLVEIDEQGNVKIVKK